MRRWSGIVAIGRTLRCSQGGCFCGRIRYEVTGTPFHETNCHCSICRRTTGAPFVAWFSVRPSEFRLASGEPVRFRSSAKGTRSFCGHCGTQLTFQGDDWLDEVDVTTSSLIALSRCRRATTPAPAASYPGFICPMPWHSIWRRGPATGPSREQPLSRRASGEELGLQLPIRAAVARALAEPVERVGRDVGEAPADRGA